MDIIEYVESRESAWSVEELAPVLNMSRKSIYKAIKRKHDPLPVIRIGSRVILNPKPTADWLRRRQQQ